MVQLSAGQLIASRLPHSVTGAGIWSIAWNTLPPCDLEAIVADAASMAQHLRRDEHARKMWPSNQTRSLAIIQPLIEYFLSIRRPNLVPHFADLSTVMPSIIHGKSIVLFIS